MSVDSTTAEPAPSTGEGRAVARREANRALLVWQDAVWSDLTRLAAQAGTGHGDPVVVFEGCLSDVADETDLELREELVLATFAGGGRRVELGHGTGTPWMWEQAVALWDDLRCVLSQVYGSAMDTALICDLERRVVYVYTPWFCPEIGPEPEAVLELMSPQDTDLDPFARMLADIDAVAVDVDARLEELLELHRVSPPSRAGHEPGECALGDLD